MTSWKAPETKPRRPEWCSCSNCSMTNTQPTSAGYYHSWVSIRQRKAKDSTPTYWRRCLPRLIAIEYRAYLEASCHENRRLYARHGFQTMRELTVANCPVLYAMWRPATSHQ